MVTALEVKGRMAMKGYESDGERMRIVFDTIDWHANRLNKYFDVPCRLI